jgi:ribosome-associated heat shock protein Hsp15
MSETEKLRLDKYLWAIRIYKTRSLASKAISEGKVTSSGENVKASRVIKIGDVFEIRTSNKDWKIKVVDFLHKRMAAATAVNFYQDFSDPIQPKQQKSESVFYFNTGKRISKVGRPTKKSRREMDDFVNDSNN